MDNRHQPLHQGRRDFEPRQQEQFQRGQEQFDDGDAMLLDRSDYGSDEDYGRDISYGRGETYGTSPIGRSSYRSGISRDRGLIDRAGDQIRSWFGDDASAMRRGIDDRMDGNRTDNRGKGPSTYTRSNERLLEETCERLTRDRIVDATDISVTCESNEVTLDGTVDSLRAKRRAEDVVQDITGVRHVQNNLRISAGN